MRFLASFVLAFLLFSPDAFEAQTNRCSSEELMAVQMEDTSFARSYFAFEAALQAMSTASSLRSSQVYTLPIVVHIMHDGDAIGTGSNLSEAQILTAVDALNQDFDGAFGGADIDIQFELASRDPEGNPSTGITRKNVSEVIPSFASTGMVTNSTTDPASELNVKALDHWPGNEYINVWVLHKLNGGTSPLGFAYLPPTSGLHDGIVVHHQVFGVGEEYDLITNFDLNRTLTHEMGHYLGLLHTFHNSSSCGGETNCVAQGDKVCDTPPTTGSIGCSALECAETLVENFMDYSNDGCMTSFTEGQRDRMRNALETQRTELTTSDGTFPVYASDAGIGTIEGIAGNGCASTVQPMVSIQNFGSDDVTQATVHFALDDGPVNTVSWTGSITSGDQELVGLPTLAAGTGIHSLMVWTTMDSDNHAANDTMTVSFEVVAGMFVDMDIQFDGLPFGISWSIENVEDGTVVMSGDGYDNTTYANAFLSESQCLVNACYELVVEDLFGNGMHYSPPGWYSLTDADGNDLGSGSGNFGAEQIHPFCIEGGDSSPCADVNLNGVCDEDEDITPVVPGCTDPLSCTFDETSNTDDGSCEYLDALGDCGGNCPEDADADGVCDNAEVPGCMDPSACNYDETATDDDGNCTYPPANFDCEGNATVVVPGCTDPESCTYDEGANTDDGSCEYLDALSECGGDCDADIDEDGICDDAEIPGCTDEEACNYEATATEEDGGCEYAAEGYDCEGNPLTSDVGNLSGLNTAIVGHPNPARLGGQVTLQGLNGSGPWIIEWWDASGRCVDRSKLMADSSGAGWSTMLDVPPSAGLHTVRVRAEFNTDAAPFVSRILIH